MTATKYNWTSTVERIGIASAVCGVLLWMGNSFMQRADERADVESTNKQELLRQLVQATIKDGEERTKQGHEMTSAMADIKATMSDLRGLNRKARENDAELLTVQKSILSEMRSQNRVPAPKATAKDKTT